MRRIRLTSMNSQLHDFRAQVGEVATPFYVHLDGKTQTLTVRGQLGRLTMYVDYARHACGEFKANIRRRRIDGVLEYFGASEATRDIIAKAPKAHSWLYTLGTHRHVKIGIKPSFRFWPTDIKRIVGIEGTYASP